MWAAEDSTKTHTPGGSLPARDQAHLMSSQPAPGLGRKEGVPTWRSTAGQAWPGEGRAAYRCSTSGQGDLLQVRAWAESIPGREHPRKARVGQRASVVAARREFSRWGKWRGRQGHPEVKGNKGKSPGLPEASADTQRVCLPGCTREHTRKVLDPSTARPKPRVESLLFWGIV